MAFIVVTIFRWASTVPRLSGGSRGSG